MNHMRKMDEKIDHNSERKENIVCSSNYQDWPYGECWVSPIKYHNYSARNAIRHIRTLRRFSIVYFTTTWEVQEECRRQKTRRLTKTNYFKRITNCKMRRCIGNDKMWNDRRPQVNNFFQGKILQQHWRILLMSMSDSTITPPILLM